MLRKSMLILSTAMLAATPIAASAAPANPASSLSLAPSARTGGSAKHHNSLFGGTLIITILLGAAIAGAVVAVATNTDNPSSN